MEVQIFSSAVAYKRWIEEHLRSPIEIISLVVLQDEIVVTYKRK
jgi:hypothetical protein